MPTFVFSSGATVEVPDGLPLCERPDTVTYDIGRSIPVGITASGRPVFSGFSCAAYAVISDLYTRQQEIARDRRRVEQLLNRGRTWNAGNLRRNTDEREQRNAQIVARILADPAPCTCVIPPVRAADLAAELDVPAEELRALVRRNDQRPAMDQSVTYRIAADGELELSHPEVIALRMHYADNTTGN